MHGRGSSDFSRDYVEEKGRSGNTFGLVISITKWNGTHIGSVRRNNESLIVH